MHIRSMIGIAHPCAHIIIECVFLAEVSSQLLLGDTSWWRNDHGEDHVVNGVFSNPEEEGANRQDPSSHVSCSVRTGLSGQLPESWQIHFDF